MTNVEKLARISILGDVRRRLGAEDENDTSEDEKINRMENTRLIGAYTGWHLGDDSWWYDLKGRFDRLEEMDKNKAVEQ